MAKAQINFGELGGGADLTEMKIIRGRVILNNTTGKEVLSKDYKYVVVINGQGNTVDKIRLNGVAQTYDMSDYNGEGSLASASYGESSVVYKDAKSGDEISATESLTVTILGFN